MFHCFSHGNYQTLKVRIGLVTANIVSKRAMNHRGPTRSIFCIQIYLNGWIEYFEHYYKLAEYFGLGKIVLIL